MKALVGTFNQEKALVGAFSVIVKTGCGTDGSFYSTSNDPPPDRQVRGAEDTDFEQMPCCKMHNVLLVGATLLIKCTRETWQTDGKKQGTQVFKVTISNFYTVSVQNKVSSKSTNKLHTFYVSNKMHHMQEKAIFLKAFVFEVFPIM